MRLFGPWDARRAHRFNGRQVAFRIDSTDQWFSGTVSRTTFAILTQTPDGHTDTIPLAWVTAAIVLPDD